RLLDSRRGSQAFDEGDHLPDLLIGHPHCRHLGSGNALPDGGIERRIRPAPAVLSARQIGAPAAFAARAVTVRAMSLEESRALRRSFDGVERTLGSGLLCPPEADQHAEETDW